MPKYVFRSTVTGEIIELQLKLAEREEFLKENPKFKQIITGSNLVSMVGGLKTDDGFKENMARIAAAHPTSELASEYGSKTVTESKKRQAVKKWKKKRDADAIANVKNRGKTND